MAFDKFLNKAKNMANDPKIREKLNSDKAEKASDSILDKAAGVAESMTNGKHTEKIQKARDAADRAVGTDGNDDTDRTEGTNGTDGTEDSKGKGEGESRP